MKKLIFSAALVLSLGLAGCGDESTNEKSKEETPAAADAGKSQTDEKKTDDKEAKDDSKEVKDGPLTEAGQWTMDGDDKVTLVKIKDVNQTYEMGPVKLSITSVKLLHHTNVGEELADYVKTALGKDIDGELNTIQVVYNVENTTDTDIMFHAVDTITTDTKAQIMGTYDIAQSTDIGIYKGKVAVEGLTILPYLNGPLTEVNSVNIITSDVWDNDNPNTLSPSQKIEITF